MIKNKSAITWTFGIILILAGVVWWLGTQGSASSAVITDYKNATYMIEGQRVTLVDGHAESVDAPGASTKTVTQYFGNPATGDLNGDGALDVAFVLTQSSGGSGTFYYAVAALKTVSGYQGTTAILLGDRIAPQTTEIQNGTLTVNYADRKSGDPMTKLPSVGMIKYLKVEGANLIEK